MKKTTVLLIAAIYVASIVVVGVFGLKSLVYTEVVYVDDILIADNILGCKVTDTTDGKGKTVTIRHQFNGDSLSVPIEWTPSPQDATYRNDIVVKIVSATTGGGEDDSYCAKLIHEAGWALIFTKNGSVTVRIESGDAKKVSKELTVYVGRPI